MNHRKTMWIPGLLVVSGLVALLLVSTGVTHATSSSSSCTWKLISSPSPGNDSNFLAGVAAASAKDVWAVGMASHQINDTLTESCQ